jgi:G:T-mismatch repair DNA endonuclease (very short patch repair protein)
MEIIRYKPRSEWDHATAKIVLAAHSYLRDNELIEHGYNPSEIRQTTLTKTDEEIPELKARVFNAENNEKRRVSHIKALRDGKYATKRDTNIERAIEQKLKNDGLVLGTDYFKQVALPANAPQFVVDFYIPKQKLVIEGYGCFWHKCTKCGYTGPRSVDEKRREVLAGEGLSLKIVWGHEI